jgi:hypothetical protein
LKKPAVLICLMVLAACGDNASSVLGGNNDVGTQLDEAAIEAGIMPNPDEIEFAGRFETRSELGTDKFCAVANGSKQFNIGFLSVSGPESKCEATGLASVDGEKVKITLSGDGNCTFDARYDGIELRFPGAVDEGCDTYCTPRASFSGTHYFMIQPGDDAARGTLGREIDRLCS